MVPPTAQEKESIEGTGRIIVRLMDTGDPQFCLLLFIVYCFYCVLFVYCCSLLLVCCLFCVVWLMDTGDPRFSWQFLVCWSVGLL